MFGGVEILVLWLLSLWVFYVIIKYAVRNGILEADGARERRARHVEAAAFAKQRELEQRPQESREAFPDDPR